MKLEESRCETFLLFICLIKKVVSYHLKTMPVYHQIKRGQYGLVLSKMKNKLQLRNFLAFIFQHLFDFLIGL